MHFIEITLFILFFAIISVPFANRFHLPLELSLVLGSCLISFLPGISQVQINPVIVFNIFLPIILFHAAYFTSWPEFKRNLRPISLLAFGLVICTMTIVAIVTKMTLPMFSWPECFLLGAILSPTDASSATSIIKKFGAPRRLITLLEGESLINDATALILFRFSLAAIIGGSFSFLPVLTQFISITAGGIGLGLLIGMISTFIIPRINSVAAETTFTFIIAFTCYILGEGIGVSGVITTVVCGIYFGIRFPAVATSQTRIYTKSSWGTLVFIINGFAFTLIGLELPYIFNSLKYEQFSRDIYYGIIISLVVIFIRVVWVFCVARLTRILFPSIAKKDPLPAWQGLFVLGWSGMRGIVSLAAALSIPFYISPQHIFLQRPLFLFITYFVIVVTLIIPTFTLPFILHYFKLEEDPIEKMHEESLARFKSLEGTLQYIEKMRTDNISDSVFNEFRKQIQRRLSIITTQLEDSPYSTLSADYLALKSLTIKSLKSERRTLLALRSTGEIHDEVFHHLSDELDLEELRAKSLRI